MFGGRSSDSSSSSSFNLDTGGPYLCEHCKDKKIINGMFGILIDCPHCSENSPKAGCSSLRRSDDEDSSVEDSFGEGYRLGDFTRGFIRGMVQTQIDPSDSEDDDYDWRRETYSKAPREHFVRKAIPPRREEVPNVQKTNAIEQPSAEENRTDVTKECVFCLENFRGWEKVHVLACGHDCHLECSGQQLTPQPKCPKCEKTYYWTGMQCSICLENMSLAEETKKLRCKHEFHVKCLSSWLQDHTTCPLCRMLVNQ